MRLQQRIAVSGVINRLPSPSLVTVARTATGLVRRLLTCTAIAVPTENDYNICSWALSSNIDGLLQARKQASKHVDMKSALEDHIGLRLYSVSRLRVNKKLLTL